VDAGRCPRGRSNLFYFIFFNFFSVVVAGWKRGKNFGFRFSIPKIPKLPELRERSREKKKVFSA
jgi:hypothetical protein